MSRPALIMAAPTGARRIPADHPKLPVAIADVAETARACQVAGASAIHLHVRDEDGRHVLDAGLYREASAAVRAATGGAMLIQITSEAVGRYGPLEQIKVAMAAEPEAVSAALRELAPGRAEEPAAARFYHWAAEAGVGVQHILYAPDEVDRLAGLIARRVVPAERLSAIFVLGRYTAGQESDPHDLLAFLARLKGRGLQEACAWMACAFGRGETAALAAALALGGHVRVGFENSLWGPDGSVAPDNAARVAHIRAIADGLARPTDDPAANRRALGRP